MHSRIRGMIAGTLTAISLLLAAVTVAAWVQSARNPWMTELEHSEAGPHGFRFNRVQYLRISGDEQMLDVYPIGTFDEWKIPWWRLILLWLCYPMWRYLPWRRLGLTNNGDTAEGRWIFFKPRPRLLSLRDDFLNLLIVHCKASYIVIAILMLYVVPMTFGDRDQMGEWLVFSGYFALAPLTTVGFVLSIFMGGDRDGLSFAVSLFYILAVSIGYLRRTNRTVNRRVRPSDRGGIFGIAKEEPPPQPSP